MIIYSFINIIIAGLASIASQWHLDCFGRWFGVILYSGLFAWSPARFNRRALYSMPIGRSLIFTIWKEGRSLGSVCRWLEALGTWVRGLVLTLRTRCDFLLQGRRKMPKSVIFLRLRLSCWRTRSKNEWMRPRKYPLFTLGTSLRWVFWSNVRLSSCSAGKTRSDWWRHPMRAVDPLRTFVLLWGWAWSP